MQRRGFLQGVGVSIALPLLPSLATARAAQTKSTPASRTNMVCIGNMLGFYPQAFWPQLDGPAGNKGLSVHRDFEMGPSSSALDAVREQLTIIQGLDHGTKGGHFSIHTFLSGVRQIDAKSMPHRNVTMDQFAAETISGQTRFPSLTIGSEGGIHGGCQLSWTKTGTRVPPIPGPAQLFKLLFVKTNAKDLKAAEDRFRLQGSILDLVNDQARSLEKRLNKRDQDKLDEYLTSVRDVEKRLALRQGWIDVPKPKAPFAAPKNRNMVEDLPLLYDLILLALQTNSTRIATLEIGGDFEPKHLGIQGGYHSLSHHGQLPERIEALIKLEAYQIEQFVRFVEKLSAQETESGRLIDQTMVLFGSGMGNANSHTNTNLPVVLAGGGFPHGRLLRFAEGPHRPPLTNLFVSMLQRFGMETDAFATSTGTLQGLA